MKAVSLKRHGFPPDGCCQAKANLAPSAPFRRLVWGRNWRKVLASSSIGSRLRSSATPSGSTSVSPLGPGMSRTARAARDRGQLRDNPLLGDQVRPPNGGKPQRSPYGAFAQVAPRKEQPALGKTAWRCCQAKANLAPAAPFAAPVVGQGKCAEFLSNGTVSHQRSSATQCGSTSGSC